MMTDTCEAVDAPRISPYIPPHVLARRLRLPERWLRDEALAGRLPVLRVGRRLMFRFEDVDRALAERSAGSMRVRAPELEGACS